MIQILGLRQYFSKERGKHETFDAFFKENWRAQSVRELFLNLEKHVAEIPPKERWNIYYTAAVCTDKKRGFLRQEILPFDVDGIDISRLEEYHAPVLGALGVEYADTGVVFSGNGLQYIIGLAQPFASLDYFNENREHYKAMCQKIDQALAAASLPGRADPSVFSGARILRFPLTENRKPDKETRLARLLQPVINPVPFVLTDRSGLPKVSVEEQISADTIRKYATPDTGAVIEGCEFLKHCKTNPNDVSEAQWYAALSVAARLEDGAQLCHDISLNYSGYNYAETERKIEQALKASGPRTCSNINSLWGKCHTCPHFEKIKSPILIKGPDHIGTEKTGFHTVSLNKKTGAVSYRPNYEDLRRFFEREHAYVVLGGSKRCFTWQGTHWKELDDAHLENYAQEHFDPYANTTMTQEFKNLICRTNLRDADWFVDTTSGRMNFRNGVLDLATMELRPHSPEYGFRYILAYDYDPTAQAPQFERFLHDVAGGDPTLVSVLMEFAGYAFSNDVCWAGKALIMTGEGSNGKSTFMEILRALAGKDNYAPLTLAELKEVTNRQMIDGRLFNLAEETPTYSVMESSIFKNLVTGGETTVKLLYKQPFTIRNKCKLMFACNELPQTRDTTTGFFRRLLIVPFKQNFETNGRKDPFIEEKLKTELPGIFNLVIAGYQRLKKQKAFTGSAAIEQQIREYKLELDTVEYWARDNMTVQPFNPEATEDQISAMPYAVVTKMFQNYVFFTEARNIKPETSIAFGRRLCKLMDHPMERRKQRKINGKNERIILGVQYVEQGDF